MARLDSKFWKLNYPDSIQQISFLCRLKIYIKTYNNLLNIIINDLLNINCIVQFNIDKKNVKDEFKVFNKS